MSRPKLTSAACNPVSVCKSYKRRHFLTRNSGEIPGKLRGLPRNLAIADPLPGRVRNTNAARKATAARVVEPFRAKLFEHLFFGTKECTMLVLTRKTREEIRIGNDIVVTIVRVKGQSVRVGIKAPSHVQIMRSELAVGKGDATEGRPNEGRSSVNQRNDEGPNRVKSAVANSDSCQVSRTESAPTSLQSAIERHASSRTCPSDARANVPRSERPHSNARHCIAARTNAPHIDIT